MRSLVLALLGVPLACGGNTVVGGTASGSGGTATGAGTTTTGSGGRGAATGGSGGTPPTDGGVGECSLCDSPGAIDAPAYVFNACTPPLEVGCPAIECTPGGTDCADGHTCDEWGAAACCYCAAVVPACVYTELAQGPLPEYLKIMPSSGTAHQDVTLQVEGFPFYVGALFYLVRVGNSGDLMQAGGTTCSLSVTVPGQPDGMVPVWVSQYGGVEPWVLAGFFDWYSSGYGAACTQPGFPCSADVGPCCETPDVPMACIEGRCRQL